MYKYMFFESLIQDVWLPIPKFVILWLVLVALLFPDCAVTVEDVVAPPVTSPPLGSHKTLSWSVQERSTVVIVPLMFIFPATQETSPEKGNSKKWILINKLVTAKWFIKYSNNIQRH